MVTMAPTTITQSRCSAFRGLDSFGVATFDTPIHRWARGREGSNRFHKPCYLVGMVTGPGTFSAVNSGSWGTAELIARANSWAAKHPGCRPLTAATLLEWRQQSLVSPPRTRGLGRGRGTAKEWSWRSYRQVLLLMRMRVSGITDNRARRYFLWQRGERPAYPGLKDDMRAVFTQAVIQLNREMRTEQWAAAEGSSTTPAADTAIRWAALDSGSWLRMFSSWGLAEDAAPYTSQLIGLLARPLVGRAIVGITYGWFVPSAESLRPALAILRQALPAELVGALPTELLESRSGMLADPRAFAGNPLLDIIEAADLETLENVLCFATAFNGFTVAVSRLADVALETDASALMGKWAMTAPAVRSVIRNFGATRPVRTPAQKLVIIALMLMRPKNAVDHALPLRTLAELTPAIGWTANHWTAARATSGDEARVRALIAGAPLPSATRRRLAELGL